MPHTTTCQCSRHTCQRRKTRDWSCQLGSMSLRDRAPQCRSHCRQRTHIRRGTSRTDAQCSHSGTQSQECRTCKMTRSRPWWSCRRCRKGKAGDGRCREDSNDQTGKRRRLREDGRDCTRRYPHCKSIPWSDHRWERSRTLLPSSRSRRRMVQWARSGPQSRSTCQECRTGKQMRSTAWSYC